MKNNQSLHDMVQIPQGQSFGNLLPAFANVKGYIYIGKPNPECASCRKPFSSIRKPRKAIRLAWSRAESPVISTFRICGQCYRLHQQGGIARDSMLASVQAYWDGAETRQ
jgi:hypothetical protein